MKSTKNFAVLLIAMLLAMVPVLSACGGNQKSADDGQNPIMNFVGTYGHDRASIFIGAEGEDGASATVNWASSAAENSTWIMSGTFDTETLTLEYHDCVKTDYVYDESGEISSQEEVYTGGHGFITFTEGDPLSLTWQDDQEHIADGTVFEFVSTEPAGTGLANPWSDAETLDEAAEGAGLDGFTIEGGEISLGTVEVSQARYMDGIAEAIIDFPASQLTIRKGLASAAAEEGDISGDYNTYANTWTQNIKGLEVTCFGDKEDAAAKIIWQLDDTCFSINALALGGEEAFGLSADDISSLINGIQ